MNLSLIRSLPVIALALIMACKGGSSSPPPPPPSTAPTLSAVSPSHGSPGATVALTGTNLTGATAVSFNGQAAFSFTVASATEIDAVVPASATTGTIQVTTPHGSATSPSFTVDVAQAPTIASFTPSALWSGATATLTGTHFVGATQVQFHGVNATSFSVISDTQIRAVAPAGLSAGAISVTTPGGTATSGTSYTVSAATTFQVLMNGDFEQASPLIWQGDTGIIQPAPGSSSPGAVPHAGTQFAYLGGYGTAKSDQITQDLFIPSSASAASATFYLKIVTEETGTTATDTLTVAALNTSGTTLGTLLTKSNLDAADYAAFTVDLLPYKGQVVRLSFKSQEDAQKATGFMLDDVTANITAPAGDLAPVITAFTPASGLAGETTIQVTGGNFFGLTGVNIGGADATYTLTDGTSLSASVPAAAAHGSASILITNAQGTTTSSAHFNVTYGAPAITSVSPTQGPIGTPVVIAGSYLGYTGTTITLNGQAITLASQSNTQITFTVPAGATSGSLVITTPGGTATSTFTINTASTLLDLHVDKIQLNQSAQTLTNTVPIVAGKAGIIRVFVLANQTNAATPSVQITLMNNGVAVSGYPKTVAAPGSSVPMALSEATLTASWNLAVPGTDLTTPTGTGYSIQATVDPANAIAEADKTNNTTTVALSGVTVPTFKTTIFPVVLSSGTGNITAANKDAWAARLLKMYPVASGDVVVGSTFTSSATLSSDGTGWSTLLSDLAAKHLADGASDRYYFGALKVTYTSGVAGLGYVPNGPSDSFKYRTAIGWDKTGYQDGGNFPEVFAHETGHNMGRNHSPCPSSGANVPSGVDPNYPYTGGLIGVWGYDTALGQLKSPSTTKDIMAYCTPNWVSDYTYQGILNFRNGTGGFLKGKAEDAPLALAQSALRECLIVRGVVHEDGTVEMLPSFRTSALPSALPGEGDFTLECQDAHGATVFSTPLELMEVGCGPKEHVRHFVMALPLDASVLEAIAGLQVLHSGQTKASLQSHPATLRASAAAPELRRMASDQMAFTWDAAIHPAAMIRDADTGEVIAILSGGSQTVATKGKRFDLVLSDGVTGPTHRLESHD